MGSNSPCRVDSRRVATRKRAETERRTQPKPNEESRSNQSRVSKGTAIAIAKQQAECRPSIRHRRSNYIRVRKVATNFRDRLLKAKDAEAAAATKRWEALLQEHEDNTKQLIEAEQTTKGAVAQQYKSDWEKLTAERDTALREGKRLRRREEHARTLLKRKHDEMESTMFGNGGSEGRFQDTIRMERDPKKSKE